LPRAAVHEGLDDLLRGLARERAEEVLEAVLPEGCPSWTGFGYSVVL
jgi:hypothetical protein